MNRRILGWVLGAFGVGVLVLLWIWGGKNAERATYDHRMDVMARIKDGTYRDYVQYWHGDETVAFLEEELSIDRVAPIIEQENNPFGYAFEVVLPLTEVYVRIKHEEAYPYLMEQSARALEMGESYGSLASAIDEGLSSAHFYLRESEDVIRYGVEVWPTATKEEKIVLGQWILQLEVVPNIDETVYREWLRLSQDARGEMFDVEGEEAMHLYFVYPSYLADFGAGQDLEFVDEWIGSDDVNKRLYVAGFVKALDPGTPGFDQRFSWLQRLRDDGDPRVREAVSGASGE